MQLDRSNLTGDGDEHQETKESSEEEKEETINQLMLLNGNNEQIPPKKRKRRKIKRDLRRQRLLREKVLKRPIIQSNADSDLESVPLAIVSDGGSESESDRDQECASILSVLPKLFQIRRDLACDLPYKFKKTMSFMGGWASASPNFVLEKKLRKADVDERRNRLLIPQRKIKTNFLEVEEEEKLNQEKWWMVEMIEPDCSVSLMTLSKWETRKGPAYVMITEWNEVVERNELKEGMKVQIWSFRAGGGGGGDGGHGRLCFALVEVGGKDEEFVPSASD